MKLTAVILLVVPIAAVAAEPSECRFIVGYAGYDAKWLVTTGPASITLTKSGFEAKLLGDPHDPQTPTHQLRGFIDRGKVAAVLTNLFSDAGPDELRGSYVSAKPDASSASNKVFDSLVVQNATVFASLACAGEGASLTHHSRGTR